MNSLIVLSLISLVMSCYQTAHEVAMKDFEDYSEFKLF